MQLNDIISHPGFIIAIIVVLAILFSQFAGGGMKSEDAHQKVAAGATLLDVRTPAEFKSGHIDGAINIPVQELEKRISEVPKGAEVVVYCRSGARSSRAAGILNKNGYTAHNLGPMSAW
jgi:rhodanese-related sulfurtransferase